MTIKKDLRDIGLSDKEIDVYINIIKNGPIKPTQLSKDTKIKRSTIYVVLDSLKERGLIAEEQDSSTLKVTALPPKNLLNSIKYEKVLIKEKEEKINETIKKIEQFRSSQDYPVPKINFIEKESIDDFLYENLDKWYSSCEKIKIGYGFQDKDFVNKKGKWVDWAIKENEKSGNRIILLSNKNEFDRQREKHKNLRNIIFSQNSNFTSTTWVVGDYIIMISLNGDKEYLVEINDKEMAHNMRELFKELILKKN